MLNVVDCAALQFSQVEGNMRKKSKHGVSKAPVLVVAVKTLSSGLKCKAAKAWTFVKEEQKSFYGYWESHALHKWEKKKSNSKCA